MMRSTARLAPALVRVSAKPATFAPAVATLTGWSGAGFQHGNVKGAIPPPPVNFPKTSLRFRVTDRPGALEETLRLFWKHDINLTQIESRPGAFSPDTCDFVVSFAAADDKKAAILQELQNNTLEVKACAPSVVPWFPLTVSDLDKFSIKTLDAGEDLEADHPGFKDQAYRDRRVRIVQNAYSYKYGQEIPRVDYTKEENATWNVVFNKLQQYTPKFAAAEYNVQLGRMMKNVPGFGPNSIPQLQDISQYLKSETGWQLRPVGGLLSARDFLAGLAFKTFFSTQYIRHHSVPLYTPEPDVCHELLGHVPLFADPQFAVFSHEIGLASLGASDHDITRLATCYWFSVEFGLLMEGGARRAYGAGLLSSFGELEYACAPYRPAGGENNYPEYKPWDPAVAADTAYPITKYQPTYFVAENMEDATRRMREFCASLPRPFYVRYDKATESIWLDREVKMATCPEGPAGSAYGKK